MLFHRFFFDRPYGVLKPVDNGWTFWPQTIKKLSGLRRSREMRIIYALTHLINHHLSYINTLYGLHILIYHSSQEIKRNIRVKHRLFHNGILYDGETDIIFYHKLNHFCNVSRTVLNFMALVMFTKKIRWTQDEIKTCKSYHINLNTGYAMNHSRWMNKKKYTQNGYIWN